MFNCAVCKKSVGPNISPVHVVVLTRAAEYDNEFYKEDEWGNRELVKVHSQGYETVKEQLVCRPCTGEEAPAPSTHIVIGGRTYGEKQADLMHVKLIACAIDNMLNRLGHNTKRAKRDTTLVVPAIKEYVDTHKDLVF